MLCSLIHDDSRWSARDRPIAAENVAEVYSDFHSSLADKSYTLSILDWEFRQKINLH